MARISELVQGSYNAAWDENWEPSLTNYTQERRLAPNTPHLQERVVPHIIAAQALERRIAQGERDRRGLLLALDVMFIDDPSQRPPPDAAFLRRRFSLTRQEARVARLLVQGHSPMEVAELIFVSRETVKSHTKSICAKTGTHRHADLCARLLTGLRRLRR